MTLTKDITAKFAVAAVAVAMIFSAYAPAAQAQTTEDLQQMINDLLAQVAQLQAQAGGGASASADVPSVCPYTWTRDLTQGSEGADVMKLQQFLNANADTRVAAAGSAGSAGMETMYYGPATAAAVSKFQVMYRAEILTPNALVNPTGYFGASSRAKANDLCVTPVVDAGDEDEDGMEEDEDEDEDEDMTLSGEGILDVFEFDDEETDLEEGDEDVAVAVATLEATDGDIEVARMTFKVENTTGGTQEDAWDVFETFSLWVDGDMVAEMDASDEDDYLDEDTGEFRFSNLDLFVGEDEEVEVLLGVSVINNVDNLDQSFDFTVENIRYFDADGVAVTEEVLGDIGGASGEEVSVDIQEAGADEELEISLASSNPDATDIIVDTDSDTNDVTIMVADLEANDNDIELDRIIVRVETSASTTDVVDEARLVIDGQSFDAESIGTDPSVIAEDGMSQYVDADGTNDAVWYLFDIDGDVVIDEDDEVEMEVVIDFRDNDDGSRYANGTTIKASVISAETDAWEAEGADDLANNQFDGTAVGDQHVLVAEGIVVPADGFSSETDTLADGQIGEFTLEFEVTAVEGNFFITDNVATTSENNGVQYTVTGGGDADITGTLTSTADEDTGVFEVREGETETFTLTVTVSGSSAVITPRVTLTAVNYTDETDGVVDGGVGVVEGKYLPLPASDFRTAVQTVQTAS